MARSRYRARSTKNHGDRGLAAAFTTGGRRAREPSACKHVATLKPALRSGIQEQAIR